MADARPIPRSPANMASSLTRAPLTCPEGVLFLQQLGDLRLLGPATGTVCSTSEAYKNPSTASRASVDAREDEPWGC